MPHDHAVNFFDHDAELVADVAGFVAEGLTRGERVVVVATAPHRHALDEVLLQHNTDAVRARITGRYLTFDAAETLGKFMVGGMPDNARFVTAVGAVVDAAAHDGCAVRVFGEMVALLWNDSNVAGAIELEALWNGLASTRRFSLRCAYPTTALGAGSLNDANRLCEMHSEVVAPRSYAANGTFGTAASNGAVQVSDVFVPVTAAVPAARRFVIEVLKSWGEDLLVADAALLASELATNAVKHAVSPFRVRVHRADAIVRITIEDVGPAQPQPRKAAPDDFGGRGIAIVQQLAARWGCDVLPDGKTVWAELPAGRP
jgi:anti-sigma regulatory factor (Ser/Thr protein kinase)